MSLNKAIEHGKEHRREYTGGKALDKTCRNHRGCEWCRGNRTYRTNQKEESCRQRIKEYEEEWRILQ